MVDWGRNNCISRRVLMFPFRRISGECGLACFTYRLAGNGDRGCCLSESANEFN
jgi:hypothetical protein